MPNLSDAEIFDDRAIEIMAALEVRSPGVNVGVAWRSVLADDTIMIVCGEVDVFRGMIEQVDPTLQHEPIIQWCRDADDSVADGDIHGRVVAFGNTMNEAVDEAIRIITTTNQINVDPTE